MARHPGTQTISLAESFREVRERTEKLCAPLEVEDFVIQSMPDASPVKWHLAHTSWFFETFVLARTPRYRPFHSQYSHLFNSYYHAAGPRWSRPERGILSRPTVADVFRYRSHVDEMMDDLLRSPNMTEELADVVILGLNHEQQHQELILTDIKHALWCNPLRPVYRATLIDQVSRQPLEFLEFEGGVVEIGHDGHGFAFDNERPRHQVFLRRYQLANRLVSNEEYLGFMKDGGYERPELWLSDGWAARQEYDWTAPLYWELDDVGQWWQTTLTGVRPVEPNEPVCHIGFYEAAAYARWAGARLPSEAEWEHAAAGEPVHGSFLEAERLHPGDCDEVNGPLRQLFGEVWQWTGSPYVGYPGYEPPAGALGEYNGKFMCNQLALRGASCATPRSHARATYRNFFPAPARWQFTGLRLAKDA
ncbi:MAG: ergothioneine biosynthesis protein EgtB [Gemmataceae bacterium]